MENIHHSVPRCSFIWILRVVYFPVKHMWLFNKASVHATRCPFIGYNLSAFHHQFDPLILLFNKSLNNWSQLGEWWILISSNPNDIGGKQNLLFLPRHYKLLKCIWHEEYLLLIWKAFQNSVDWYFSFWNIFFRFREIDIFLLCKLDQWWHHKVCN